MNDSTAPRGSFSKQKTRTDQDSNKPFWIDSIYECLPTKEQQVLRSLRALTLVKDFPMSPQGFASILKYEDSEKYSRVQQASRHLKHLTRKGLVLQIKVGMYDQLTRKGPIPTAKYGYRLSELGVSTLFDYESMTKDEIFQRLITRTEDDHTQKPKTSEALDELNKLFMTND